MGTGMEFGQGCYLQSVLFEAILIYFLIIFTFWYHSMLVNYYIEKHEGP